jgi:hypothetical protein
LIIFDDVASSYVFAPILYVGTNSISAITHLHKNNFNIQCQMITFDLLD